ncbi:hypothetical protein KR084_008895, partial [Drosophila pseudotakahashii]
RSRSVDYQNVRSLLGKLKRVYSNSTSHDFDIIAITETWLNSTVYNKEIFVNKFAIYRLDRPTRGSGVLIAVLNSISSKLIPFDNIHSIELIAVKITTDKCYV